MTGRKQKGMALAVVITETISKIVIRFKKIINMHLLGYNYVMTYQCYSMTRYP